MAVPKDKRSNGGGRTRVVVEDIDVLGGCADDWQLGGAVVIAAEDTTAHAEDQVMGIILLDGRSRHLKVLRRHDPEPLVVVDLEGLAGLHGGGERLAEGRERRCLAAPCCIQRPDAAVLLAQERQRLRLPLAVHAQKVRETELRPGQLIIQLPP